jgi:hypothetical protein
MSKIISEKFGKIYRVSIHLQRSHEALAIVQTTGVGKEISVFTRRRVIVECSQERPYVGSSVSPLPALCLISTLLLILSPSIRTFESQCIQKEGGFSAIQYLFIISFTTFRNNQLYSTLNYPN